MSDHTEVRTSATGTVHGAPDGVELTFTVGASAVDYAQSLETLNTRVSAIDAALGLAGVAGPLATAAYGVAEQWSNQYDADQRKFEGFRATQTLSVTVGFDLDLLRSVFLEVGRSSARPSVRTRFVVRDPDSLHREARRLAVRTAKADAQDLAREVGLELRGSS